MRKKEIKQNISDGKQWIRLLYVLLFICILYVTISVLWIVIIVQALHSIVVNKTNENIRQFSSNLAKYINQVVLFLSYNEDTVPYPFTPWNQDDEVKKLGK